MAILLVFLAFSVLLVVSVSLPLAYAAGRRRERRESNAEARRDLLDRAERYALTDKDQERAYAATLLALLSQDDPHRGLPTKGWPR